MPFKNWFIVQFKKNNHKVAERNLNLQGFETFLPMQEITIRKPKRFLNKLVPLFPGYMFVAFDPENDDWRKINSTTGVAKLLFSDIYLRPIPLELVNGLKLRCSSTEKIKNLILPKKGHKIKIMQGPLANFVATVEALDADNRLDVLIEFMGRPIKTKIKA